jgi:hypothetical protein
MSIILSEKFIEILVFRKIGNEALNAVRVVQTGNHILYVVELLDFLKPIRIDHVFCLGFVLQASLFADVLVEPAGGDEEAASGAMDMHPMLRTLVAFSAMAWRDRHPERHTKVWKNVGRAGRQTIDNQIHFLLGANVVSGNLAPLET